MDQKQVDVGWIISEIRAWLHREGLLTGIETPEGCVHALEGALIPMRLADTLGDYRSVKVLARRLNSRRTYEHVLSVQTALVDGSTDVCLALVCLGCVDEPVGSMTRWPCVIGHERTGIPS